MSDLIVGEICELLSEITAEHSDLGDFRLQPGTKVEVTLVKSPVWAGIKDIVHGCTATAPRFILKKLSPLVQLAICYPEQHSVHALEHEVDTNKQQDVGAGGGRTNGA